MKFNKMSIKELKKTSEYKNMDRSLHKARDKYAKENNKQDLIDLMVQSKILSAKGGKAKNRTRRRHSNRKPRKGHITRNKRRRTRNKRRRTRNKRHVKRRTRRNKY